MRTRARARLVAGLLAVLACPLAAPAVSYAVAPSPAPSPGPDPAAEDACAGASEEEPVRLEVSTLLPRAPSRPDEPFQLAGRVRNCGEQALTGLQLRLAVGGRLASRGELQRADEEPVVGARRLTRAAAATELAPGATTPFDLRLRVADLQLGRRIGVYPLALQAVARYGDDRDRTPVGLVSTFVPWFPDGAPAPTRIAWLWPLVDQPRRTPDEALLDDVLGELVDPGDASTPAGRLHELLTAGVQGSRGACDPAAAPDPAAGPAADPAAPLPCRGEAVPLTWAVDPSLVGSLDAMTRPYAVLEGGERTDRPASDDAASWLGTLRSAAPAGDLLALPYGDPDVTAMARSDGDLRDDVEQLRRLGEAEVRRLLQAEPLAQVAWPPPGPLPPSLDAVVGAGTTAVVLDPSALPPAPAARNRTPGTRTELPSVTGSVGGLVVEGELSRLLEPEDERAQGDRLAEQRWIAETAILAAEAPSTSRTLVVAPSRQADVDPDVAAAVLADSGRLPWLCPVALAAVAAGTERCAGLPDAQAPAAAEPLATDADPGRGEELSPAFLEELAQVAGEGEQFTESVLVSGTEPATRTRARLLRATGRAASTAWREQPLQGERMLRLLSQEVTGLRSRVRLVSQPITLTGSSGVLDLVVQNELDQPVNVGVALDETSAARLSLSSTSIQVVPARNATSLRVRVEPRTSGRFVVQAHLVDEDGRPFGETVRLDVRSTEYGRVALAVTGVAAAVLMVAAGARITRRALRRPRATP